MRRKQGQLIPIEVAILEAATLLRARNIDEFHGFGIASEIRDNRDAKSLIGHGTLYRALGRLEQLGFLKSRWEDPTIAEENGRPRRKLYQLTGAEKPVLARLDVETGKPQRSWRTANC